MGELARVARLRGYKGAIFSKYKSTFIALRLNTNSNNLML